MRKSASTARIPLLPETRAVRTLSATVMSLMIALGIIALAGVAAFRHVDLDWRRSLSGRWTVELNAEPQKPVTQPEAEHIVSMLETIPGIKKAALIGPQEIRGLLQPWLGDTATMTELPLPTLIDLDIDQAAPPSPVLIRQHLTAIMPRALLDDHHVWTNDLVRLAETGEGLGLALFAAIMLSAVLTVIVTARGRLAVNRAEIELLHVIGASDFYIAQQFQIGAFRSASWGAAAGTVIAGGTIAILTKAGTAFIPLIPALHLDFADWAVLTAVPLGAILIAALVARLTARNLLRRLI